MSASPNTNSGGSDRNNNIWLGRCKQIKKIFFFVWENHSARGDMHQLCVCVHVSVCVRACCKAVVNVTWSRPMTQLSLKWWAVSYSLDYPKVPPGPTDMSTPSTCTERQRAGRKREWDKTCKCNEVRMVVMIPVGESCIAITLQRPRNYMENTHNSGGARGVSGVELDTPDIWLAAMGATPKTYMLLFHFLCLIARKEAFILATNSRMWVMRVVFTMLQSVLEVRARAWVVCVKQSVNKEKKQPFKLLCRTEFFSVSLNTTLATSMAEFSLSSPSRFLPVPGKPHIPWASWFGGTNTSRPWITLKFHANGCCVRVSPCKTM